MDSAGPVAALDLAPSPTLTALKAAVRKLRGLVAARSPDAVEQANQVGLLADRYVDEQGIPDAHHDDHPFRDIDMGLASIYDLAHDGEWAEADRVLAVGEARLGMDKDKDTEYTGGRKHRRTTRKRKGKKHRRATRRR